MKGLQEKCSAVVDAVAFNLRIGVRVRSVLCTDRRVRPEVIVAGQDCPLGDEVAEVRNEGINCG